MVEISESSRAAIWWHPLWEFCTHALVGTGIFLLVAMPAVALNLLVVWLADQEVDTFIIYGLHLAEYSLFAVDVTLFLIFLARITWRAFKDI